MENYKKRRSKDRKLMDLEHSVGLNTDNVYLEKKYINDNIGL